MPGFSVGVCWVSSSIIIIQPQFECIEMNIEQKTSGSTHIEMIRAQITIDLMHLHLAAHSRPSCSCRSGIGPSAHSSHSARCPNASSTAHYNKYVNISIDQIRVGNIAYIFIEDLKKCNI